MGSDETVPVPDPRVRPCPNLWLKYWEQRNNSDLVLIGSACLVRIHRSGRNLGQVAAGPPPVLRGPEWLRPRIRWRGWRRVPSTSAREEIRRVDVTRQAVPPTPPAFAERTVHPATKFSVQWPPDFLRTVFRCRPKFGGRFLIQSSRYSTVHFATPNARRLHRFDGSSAARRGASGCIVLYHTA